MTSRLPLLFLLLTCFLTCARSQALTTVPATAPATSAATTFPAIPPSAEGEISDDISPMQAAGIFLFVIFLLCVVGIACALTLIAFALIGIITLLVLLLVALGILSTSVIVGLARKSISKGAITFIMLTASAAGALAGSIAAPLSVSIFRLTPPLWAASSSGLLVGAITGAMIGYLVCHFLTALATYFIHRFNRANSSFPVELRSVT